MLKPQGRRGEVLAELHTDFPERFEERRELSGLAPDGSRRELKLEEHWFHKGGVVLKFAGVETISDAEKLAGMEVQVPVEQRSKLESGAAYVSDLVGSDVWDGQRFLGRVSDVQFGAGEAPLLIVAGADGKKYDLPFAEAYVVGVDLAGKQLLMRLPAGMLEINAPLTAEEKGLTSRSGREKASITKGTKFHEGKRR